MSLYGSPLRSKLTTGHLSPAYSVISPTKPHYSNENNDLLISQIQELRSRTQNLSKTQSEATIKATNAETTNSNLSNEITTLRLKLQNALNKVSSLNNDVLQLNNEKRKMQLQIDSDTDALAAKDHEVQTQRSIIQELEHAKDIMQRDIRKADETIRTFNEEKQEWHEKLTAIKQRHAQMESENLNLLGIIESNNTTNGDFKTQYDALTKVNESIVLKNKSLKKKMLKLQQFCKTAKDKFEILKNQRNEALSTQKKDVERITTKNVMKFKEERDKRLKLESENQKLLKLVEKYRRRLTQQETVLNLLDNKLDNIVYPLDSDGRRHRVNGSGYDYDSARMGSISLSKAANTMMF